MANLARTWACQKRWNDAIYMMQDCVRRRERYLGFDHPDTIDSASALSDWEAEFEASESGPLE
ncbi:Kinesin light chain 1 [Colletotrichum graminicola]|nr:Kinesin light chain 1 [Colletotrichum graminicola]